MAHPPPGSLHTPVDSTGSHFPVAGFQKLDHRLEGRARRTFVLGHGHKPPSSPRPTDWRAVAALPGQLDRTQVRLTGRQEPSPSQALCETCNLRVPPPNLRVPRRGLCQAHLGLSRLCSPSPPAGCPRPSSRYDSAAWCPLDRVSHRWSQVPIGSGMKVTFPRILGSFFHVGAGRET